MNNIELPLVSVGIPTYERPEGLRNTLQYITQQSYKNLEVIVSDNCSSGNETREVVEQFMRDYSYIKYFRQEKNIGIMANFKFVLEKSSGEYFMWAADDDEWHNNFIEVCAKHFSSSSSVMTGFETHYRKSNLRIINKLPFLNNHTRQNLNVKKFLYCMQPSLMYGLHRRLSILFFLKEDFFDFFDCYFVIKVILTAGFETMPDEILYAAGIDGDEYVLKHADHKKKKLKYWPFYKAVVTLVLKSEKINMIEKIGLIKDVSIVVAKLYRYHENIFWKSLFKNQNINVV